MSLWKRLIRRRGPKVRIRICVECGKPIAEHKDWCSLLRGQSDWKPSADVSTS